MKNLRSIQIFFTIFTIALPFKIYSNSGLDVSNHLNTGIYFTQGTCNSNSNAQVEGKEFHKWVNFHLRPDDKQTFTICANSLRVGTIYIDKVGHTVDFTFNCPGFHCRSYSYDQISILPPDYFNK